MFADHDEGGLLVEDGCSRGGGEGEEEEENGEEE